MDTVQDQFRTYVRPRDHSADNILSTTVNTPTYVSSVQRSISFKHSEEIYTAKLKNRSILNTERDEEEGKEDEEGNDDKNDDGFNDKTKNESPSEDANVNNTNSIQTTSCSSSQEHIYDNFDLFSSHKTNFLPDTVSNDDESLTNIIVNTRRDSTSRINRSRPITMYIPKDDTKQMTTEFEKVFNQIRKYGLMKKLLVKDEIIPESATKESIESSPSKETQEILSTESLVEGPIAISRSKVVETSSSSPLPIRRKTVGGVNVSTNKKVTTDDEKSIPSWINIARQKQSNL